MSFYSETVLKVTIKCNIPDEKAREITDELQAFIAEDGYRHAVEELLEEIALPPLMTPTVETLSNSYERK